MKPTVRFYSRPLLIRQLTKSIQLDRVQKLHREQAEKPGDAKGKFTGSEVLSVAPSLACFYEGAHHHCPGEGWPALHYSTAYWHQRASWPVGNRDERAIKESCSLARASCLPTRDGEIKGKAG